MASLWNRKPLCDLQGETSCASKPRAAAAGEKEKRYDLVWSVGARPIRGRRVRAVRRRRCGRDHPRTRADRQTAAAHRAWHIARGPAAAGRTPGRPAVCQAGSGELGLRRGYRRRLAHRRLFWRALRRIDSRSHATKDVRRIALADVREAAAVLTRGWFDLSFEDSALDEQLEKVSVELPVFHFRGEDVECAVGRDRALVRPVLRGERVVDVADRHHARLYRNRVRRDATRISPAVHLLVMAIGDERDLLQLARPRNALQKLIGVRHVTLDLVALGVVEAALADRQVAHLVG